MCTPTPTVYWNWTPLHLLMHEHLTSRIPDHVAEIEGATMPPECFDLYTNPARPTLALYVRKGAGLPDLADPSDWSIEGEIWSNEIPPEVLKTLEANGHVFQELGA